MTEKRYSVYGKEIVQGDECWAVAYSEYNADVIVTVLNELAEENQFLKEKEKDMLDYLKKEYDYAYKQRMKHLDDAVLTSCYEMIEYHIRSMIEHLERI